MRLRCTLCKKIVGAEEVTTGLRYESLYKKLGVEESGKYHERLGSRSSGIPGHYGTQTFLVKCGPVEEENPDDYILCLEHFLGIAL